MVNIDGDVDGCATSTESPLHMANRIDAADGFVLHSELHPHMVHRSIANARITAEILVLYIFMERASFEKISCN